MIDQQDILSELANVQKDPHIARSSILSRLLAYLVEQSLSNARKGLNSYAVAVDGLGRTADFDPQTDSYARVQVARLRRALDAHYVGPGKDRPVRISIEPRSYEARLVPNEDCLPQAPDDGASLGSDRLRTSGRRARQGGIAAILIGLVVLAYVTYARQQAKDLANWQTSNFPTLAVEIEGYGNNADPANAMLRDRFLGSLAKYEGIRVNYSRKWTNDFRLQVRTRQLPDSTSVDLTLIDEKTGRLLWSQAGQISGSELETAIPGRGYVSQAAFQIVHPTGAIHSYTRRRISSPSSPYGCWLRFMGQLQTEQNTADDTLASCAKSWHSAAPDHPLAAALRGWSLLDQSIGKLTETDRLATIWQARDLLERAGQLNPDSAFLQLTMMRAYAFSGDESAMRQKGVKALTLNPENPDVQGMVGTLLAMRGDPHGEALLRDAIANHSNPPPRYFIGIFLGAMMREDIGEASAALENIRQFHHNLPVVAVLEAALLARTGKTAAARRSWAKAKAIMPVLRVQPHIMFKRLPLARAVRDRLIQWSSPAYS